MKTDIDTRQTKNALIIHWFPKGKTCFLIEETGSDTSMIGKGVPWTYEEFPGGSKWIHSLGIELYELWVSGEFEEYSSYSLNTRLIGWLSCILVAPNRIDVIGEGICLPLLISIALISRICYPRCARLKSKSHISPWNGRPSTYLVIRKRVLG